ncbi:MAG: hypothetical protein NTU69_12995, partial [Proteobacteria bacterium]|nr:hypothetical protein [Pseudomonadota bacterium]
NFFSETYSAANPKNITNLQNFVLNLMYDVNPAVRFGLEYTRITTGYASRTAATQGNGSMDAFRFGAYYFF